MKKKRREEPAVRKKSQQQQHQEQREKDAEEEWKDFVLVHPQLGMEFLTLPLKSKGRNFIPCS